MVSALKESSKKGFLLRILPSLPGSSLSQGPWIELGGILKNKEIIPEGIGVCIAGR